LEMRIWISGNDYQKIGNQQASSLLFNSYGSNMK
jgi:hypothetical protein